MNSSTRPSIPGGTLVFHLFGALAEFERAMIRERARAGCCGQAGRARCCKTRRSRWRRWPHACRSRQRRSTGTFREAGAALTRHRTAAQDFGALALTGAAGCESLVGSPPLNIP
ncbi:MAG TPA: recombinase family protein [Candidatus Tectomicrobia bacterium]